MRSISERSAEKSLSNNESSESTIAERERRPLIMFEGFLINLCYYRGPWNMSRLSNGGEGEC